ncbi:MAG TPA: GNAT family N-acetyltransferase [Polyangiaceae bacterium]
MRITELTPELLGAWASLFEKSESACFCHYWHFEGTKNEWLARCFQSPTDNRDDQTKRIVARAPESRGLLAMEDEHAIGWMKLAPRALLPKLRRQGAYRSLDLGDDEGIWSIGCLLVRPDRRRHGVARALVKAAPDHVKAWGGTALEAYPHRVPHPQHDEEAWMGPESLYAALVTERWQPIHDVPPYPVWRLTL